MALIAIYSRERHEREEWADTLVRLHDVEDTPSWEGFARIVRERPTTAGIIDMRSLGSLAGAAGRVHRFRSAFPGFATVLVVGSHRDPTGLFRLGRLGVGELVLAELENVGSRLAGSVARALKHGAAARTLREISPFVAPRELAAVRLALDRVHRSISAEDLAEEVGLSRPFLSERLKDWGLPSVGRFLLWTRLLHAGYWLPDPGRTGESVSRQLAYANGSVFRRALRTRTGATPGEVIRGGGYAVVLRHFLDDCEFAGIARKRRFSAA